MGDIKHIKKTMTCGAALLIVTAAAILMFLGKINTAEFTSYTAIVLGALYGIMNKFMADSEKEKTISMAKSITDLLKTKESLEKENKDLSFKLTGETLKRVGIEKAFNEFKNDVEQSKLMEKPAKVRRPKKQ